jgi:hypothetical protein
MNCSICGLWVDEFEVGAQPVGSPHVHSGGVARCVKILQIEIAGLRDSLSVAERERDIAIDTRNLAQAASSEAVLARQNLQAELDRRLAYCVLQGQCTLASVGPVLLADTAPPQRIASEGPCPACLEHRRHTEEDWKFHPEKGAGRSRDHGAINASSKA